MEAAQASPAFSTVARFADINDADSVERLEFSTLRGVPLAVKANICTGDSLPTCAGSEVLKEHVPHPGQCSTVISRFAGLAARIGKRPVWRRPCLFDGPFRSVGAFRSRPIVILLQSSHPSTSEFGLVWIPFLLFGSFASPSLY